MYGRIGRQKMLAEIYKECGSIFGKGNTTMTDKQIIIYKKECYNEPHCSLNQVLEQLKAKEQECEFSNLRIIQLQETLSQYETDLSTKDCIVETCKAQYKELKAENEKLDTENKRLVAELANPVFDSFEELDRLKQTLTEIKEIAEGCQYGDCHECKYQPRTDCRTELIAHILQKISEVEDANV